MQRIRYRDLKVWNIPWPELKSVTTRLQKKDPTKIITKWEFMNDGETPIRGIITLFVPSKADPEILSFRILRFTAPDHLTWETSHMPSIDDPTGIADIEKELDHATGGAVKCLCAYIRWDDSTALALRTQKKFIELAKAMRSRNEPTMVDIKRRGVLQWDDEAWDDDFVIKAWEFVGPKAVNVTITEDGVVLVADPTEELNGPDLAVVMSNILERAG